MSNIFLASDHHLGHIGVTQFLNQYGNKLRPWDTIEEMDEALIENHNKVVSPKDRVYFLGDVIINRKHMHKIARFNGRKKLIMGNHCIFKASEYLQYFEDLKAYHVLDNIICSHIPIHAESKGRFLGNVHGHLHSNNVMLDKHRKDPWYFNVSVEQINYTPIPLETIRKHFSDL